MENGYQTKDIKGTANKMQEPKPKNKEEGSD